MHKMYFPWIVSYSWEAGYETIPRGGLREKITAAVAYKIDCHLLFGLRRRLAVAALGISTLQRFLTQVLTSSPFQPHSGFRLTTQHMPQRKLHWTSFLPPSKPSTKTWTQCQPYNAVLFSGSAMATLFYRRQTLNFAFIAHSLLFTERSWKIASKSLRQKK